LTAATASRVVAGIDVRHLHAHHAAVHDGLDVAWGLGFGARDGGDAGGIAGHRHQLHVVGRNAAVLAIDEHPVKTSAPQHLDNLR
jgi:hypothetical protein